MVGEAIVVRVERKGMKAKSVDNGIVLDARGGI
jgi:hypothetical protein